MTMFQVAALSLNRSSGRPNSRPMFDIFGLRTLTLDVLHSSCVRTGVRSGSPYLLVSNVNEPVSLPVRIIMRPVIHVGRYFITYSIIITQMVKMKETNRHAMITLLYLSMTGS